MQQGSASQKALLVLDYTTNWYTRFKGAKVGDLQIKVNLSYSYVLVEQAEWKDIHVEADANGKTRVAIKKAEDPLPFSTQKEDRVISPDFVLIRNFPSDIHDNTFRNIVIGLAFNKLPGVNSIDSVLRCMDRPMVYAELLAIQRSEAGRASGFNVVPMTYYANLKASTQRLLAPKSYPAVIKVASTHAGYGKAQVQDDAGFKDLACILALHSDYYTAEPFVAHDDDHEKLSRCAQIFLYQLSRKFRYEFRVQKIGSHYRAFRRNSDTSWKNNWGNLQFKDHDWQPQYTVWADEVAKIFGGLDIISIDVLHGKDGRDYVLEINDTAGGLMYEHEDEDLNHIREVVLQKMAALWHKPCA